MKGRLGSTIWTLVGVNAAALLAVLVLAYEAGAGSGGLGLRDAGALGRSSGFLLLGAMSVALATTLTLILRLGARVLKPVEELVAFSDRITAGDYEQPALTVTRDDFAIVAGGLIEASAKLADIQRIQAAQELLQQNLRELCGTLEKAAGGDTSVRAITAYEELAEPVRLINAVLDRFAGAIHRVTKAATGLSGSVGQILVSSEELGLDVSQQNQELGKAQAAATQVSAGLRQISSRLDGGVEAANRALEAASHGKDLLLETADGIQHVRGALEETATRLKALGDRSLEVYDIINVVNETNLMALNTAVEASRASDGHRTLDLAAELNKLSEHSRNATKDIVALLKALQAESNHALAAMEQGNREVNLGARLTESAVKSLDMIHGLLQESTHMAEAVGAVAQEQVQTIETAAASLQKSTGISRQSGHCAQQITGALEDLVKISGQLNELVAQHRTPAPVAPVKVARVSEVVAPAAQLGPEN